MSIDSRPVEEMERLDTLERLLDAAIADARRWDYDMPSERAVERARELLSGFAHEFVDISAFEVSAAVDGAFEITAGGSETYVSVTVSPDGERTHAGTIDTKARCVTWSASEPTLLQLVEEIKRAA